MAKADGRPAERRCDERGRWGAREGKVHADSKWAFAATEAGTWDLWDAHNWVWARANDNDGRAYG